MRAIPEARLPGRMADSALAGRAFVPVVPDLLPTNATRAATWLRHGAALAALPTLLRGDATTAAVAVVGAVAVWQMVVHTLLVLRVQRSDAVCQFAPGGLAVADAIALCVAALVGLPSVVVLAWGALAFVWHAAIANRRSALAAAVTGACVIGALLVDADLSPWLVGAGLGAATVVAILDAIDGQLAEVERSQQVQRALAGVNVQFWTEVPGVDGAMWVSEDAGDVLGYGSERWLEPEFWRTIVHPEDHNLVEKEMAQAIRRRENHTFTFRWRHADGSWRWIENQVTSARTDDGHHRYFVGAMVDRTEQVEIERRLEGLARVVSASPIGQMLVERCDDEVVVRVANDAARGFLGLDSGDAVNQGRFEDVARAQPEFDPALALLRGELSASSVEVQTGDERILRFSARHGTDGTSLVEIVDVTDEVIAAARQEFERSTDPVTGLMNGASFTEQFAIELVNAGSHRFAVMCVQLTNMPEISETLGHEVGDDLLRIVARRVTGIAGLGSLASHHDRGEFRVAMLVSDQAEAKHQARTLLRRIAEPVVRGRVHLRIHARAGICLSGVDDAPADVLIRRSAAALREGTRGGRDLTVHEPGAINRAMDRIVLAGELDPALRNGEFVLHHQPLVDLATGETIGSEVLVRWMHPERGLIPPNEFIELAEISGQIERLTRWVIGQALVDLKVLDTEGRAGIVSCNVSARNLGEEDFVDWVASALFELGIEAHRLRLEITESTVISSSVEALASIEALRRIGVAVWIDDFGTGHSSFSRLNEFGVDGVKIDRDFVVAASESDKGRVMLRAVIDVVRSLGMTTIAEGVETPEQLQLLRHFGCDVVQGYFLARPMPLNDLIGFLSPAVGESIPA